MLNSLVDLVRPLLFAMDPEQAHDMTLRALEAGILGRDTAPAYPCLEIKAMGLSFPNPIGIAAGFDKDARVCDALLDLGFGFTEAGTITPLPQQGNAKPRVFRLLSERGVINRLGFNNRGHDMAYTRLASRAREGIVGVNIGANRDTLDKADDYIMGIERFYGLADYFMINISSPNTPGLRDLQAPELLNDLLKRVNEIRERCADASGKRVPVVVKLAPDIAREDLAAVVERLLENRTDAIAVSNTTLARPRRLAPHWAQESGGLSGRPLFHRSTVMLAQVYRATQGAVPLIGIGGIDSGATALDKIEAGASLIQLYTGLIYEGLPLTARIKAHFTEAVKSQGVQQIGDLTGLKANEWAEKPLENT